MDFMSCASRGMVFLTLDSTPRGCHEPGHPWEYECQVAYLGRGGGGGGGGGGGRP